MNQVKNTTRPALFLDRDGTINYDPGYISNPKGVRILFGVRGALLRFRERGYRLIVISNQSGIGRGYLTANDLVAINSRISARLGRAAPDAYYHCPHLPEDNCPCRKPGTGNLKKACLDWSIDIEKSLIVGDSRVDLAAGWNFGIPAYLVLTGHGRKSWADLHDAGEAAGVQSFAHLGIFAQWFWSRGKSSG